MVSGPMPRGDLEARRAKITARGEHRRLRALLRSRHRRAAREHRYAVARSLKRDRSKRIRRGLLRFNRLVRALPEAVRRAYDATSPAVRRLIVQQHVDDRARVVGTGLDVSAWYPDTRLGWKTSWNAFRRRANADAPRMAARNG